MSSFDLAVALADRLDAVTPPGIGVRARADGGLVVLHLGQVVGISGAVAILETVDALREPRENLESAVRAALSAVQDYVADVTTEPWPGTGGHQPNPDARAGSDAILMWFGPADAPVLRLPPIALAAPS